MFTIFRPLSVDSLNGRSTDALKIALVEKKIGKKKVYCHIFANIFANSIGNIFFYLPDRLTAENPPVKNPPFKESTDDGLTRHWYTTVNICP